MSKKIKVLGTEIALSSQKKEDYISLTIEFLGLWERINNPDFKVVEFDQFRNQAGNNSFVLSPQKWISEIQMIMWDFTPCGFLCLLRRIGADRGGHWEVVGG